MIDKKLQKSGIKRIAGVDEAGRGACAGPLVVAAVILADLENSSLEEVRDSKELSPAKREKLFPQILDNSISYSIIEISPFEIDEKGLHKCNIEGMRRAINSLSVQPDYVLTDGYEVPGLSIANLAVWKGDQVALSISAASIIAKVHRDRLMTELDREFPGYRLSEHKGYATAAHDTALRELGVSSIHRRSYSNIAKFL
ncbi:MAG: ribonuclease HII [Actinomycetales bacterium]|nr:ribonuclease HII [Actinomycetales bacterium]